MGPQDRQTGQCWRQSGFHSLPVSPQGQTGHVGGGVVPGVCGVLPGAAVVLPLGLGGM